MALNRTTLVLETAEAHLGGLPDSTPNKALVAVYLAQVATVTFCSEIEESLIKLIRDRLSRAENAKVAHFITKTNEGMIKRVPKSDIVKTVGLFGEQATAELNAIFTDQEITKYGNVVNARHTTAHGAGGTVTLKEVAEATEIAERMLTTFDAVIT